MGEANPRHALVVKSDMWLMVLTSVNVNAVTKTNWRGIGVIPDLKIKSERAFLAAQELTYKELAAMQETLK